MGIYDQLTQLDEAKSPSLPQKADKSLNPEPKQEQPSPKTATTSTKKKSKKARLQESKITSMKESKKARLPARKQESLLADIQPYLDLRASNTVSFRYPDVLLDWLEESLYRFKKEQGTKLTKTAVLVAALAYVLWDLEQNGKESFLYQAFAPTKD